LLNNSYLLVVPSGIKVFDVRSIEENFALFRIVEAFDH
jgi:hypothetical protein